ncbi:hypothetical protein [Streptomyces triticiradicis]|uniref:AAA+ ATPase domain-containing protein n=1 Tax=Streptomyces triticiradicis TaxID=2651189 RepID=A0A7J5D3F1_9ACTN|nr:hypothetical protein [Streptomyces triticiradicis]KAB1978518.1 hypothetical protein F8144_39435 [Streptomyces triticiradicis]
MITPVLFLAGLAGGGAILASLGASVWWAAPGAAALAVVADVGVRPWLEQRQAGGQLDRTAVAALRVHAGRRGRLPRVVEGDPLRLGVHPAVSLPHGSGADAEPGPDPKLPTWVRRTVYGELVDWLREEAAVKGGFVLIEGDSSVGKTRLAYEAIREALPRFVLLQPDDAALVNQLADATFRLPKLVIWLDEIQRYLVGADRTVTLPALRRLLDAPTPVVIVGTLWPETYARLTAMGTDHMYDHPEAAEVLRFHALHRVFLGTFDAAEREAAGELTEADPRLGVATADARYGVTEVLAGGPAVVQRWQEARPAVRAVITATIDARRMGLRDPMEFAFLRDLSRAYLPAPAADDSWFEPALAEATEVRPGEGVIAPLSGVADADNRAFTGYVVADYLLQHAERVRADAAIPALAWHTVTRYLADAYDLFRAAMVADDQGVLAPAEHLYRAAHDAGHTEARPRLALVLAAQGRADEGRSELREAIAAGRRELWPLLADLLERQGRVDDAALARREAIAVGDPDGRRALADMLHAHGREAEAEQVWRDAVEAGEPTARCGLADLLELRRDAEAAEDAWRAAVDAAEPGARVGLADFLGHQQRRTEQAELWSQARAAGDVDVKSAQARWSERTGIISVDDWEAALVSGDHLSLAEWTHLHKVFHRLSLPSPHTGPIPVPDPWFPFRSLTAMRLASLIFAPPPQRLEPVIRLVRAEQHARQAPACEPAGLCELLRARWQACDALRSYSAPYVFTHHQLVRDIRHRRTLAVNATLVTLGGLPPLPL